MEVPCQISQTEEVVERAALGVAEMKDLNCRACNAHCRYVQSPSRKIPL
jgi:hypothetical protein